MRLDRYVGAPPKFRVFKADADGKLVEVPAWDCFVLKRRDINADNTLAAYAYSAGSNGDRELSEDVHQLRKDWAAEERDKHDTKMPD